MQQANDVNIALKDAFVAELKHEATSTKKILDVVPFEYFSWKPHEKSMTLGRLTTHVAEIPHWVSDILTTAELDFEVHPPARHIAGSHDELMDIFHTTLDKALKDLQAAGDQLLEEKWIIRRGEMILSELPRKIVLRNWAFNHLYHHRGQLSVFLRLLNVRLPGMYGPSADEL